MPRGRPPNRSLYLRRLPESARPEDVKAIFSRYGYVRDVYIPCDHYTNRPRGFAYVEFEDLRGAEDAVYDLGERGLILHGYDVDVEFAMGERKTPGEMKYRYGPLPYTARGYRDRSRSRSRSRRRHRRSRSRSRRRSHKRHRRSRSKSSRSASSRSRSRSASRKRSKRRHRSRSRSSRRHKRDKSRSRSKNSRKSYEIEERSAATRNEEEGVVVVDDAQTENECTQNDVGADQTSRWDDNEGRNDGRVLADDANLLAAENHEFENGHY